MHRRTFFNRGAIFFEDLERMLFLSDHFKSLRLRDCAISGLTMLFPTTLEHHRRYTRNNAVRLVPATYAIDTLHLCIHHHIPDVLLIVMYTLSNYDHRFLVHGILDRTRNTDWVTTTFYSNITINGVVVKDVEDARSVPAPMRVQDLQVPERKWWKTTLEDNKQERLTAAEERRLPQILFDPEFDRRELFARILRGRTRMQTARREILFGFLREIPSFPDDLGVLPTKPRAAYDPYGYKFSKGCTSVSKMDIPPLDSVSCATALKALMTALWEPEARRFTKNRSLNQPRHALRVLPLRTEGEWGLHEEWRKVLCPSCLSKLKFEMKRGQQELWSKLPEFFGMTSWFDIEFNKRRATEEIAKRSLQGDYDGEKGAEGALYNRFNFHPDRKDATYLDDLELYEKQAEAETAKA